MVQESWHTVVVAAFVIAIFTVGFLVLDFFSSRKIPEASQQGKAFLEESDDADIVRLDGHGFSSYIIDAGPHTAGVAYFSSETKRHGSQRTTISQYSSN